MLQFRSLGGPAIQCRTKEKTLSVFFDAHDKPAEKNEYVLLSAPRDGDEPDASTISWPGEYDFAGVSIKGIGHGDGDQVSYVLTAEGLRVGCISSPITEWGDHEIELLGDLDVLVIPADDSKRAQAIIEEVDPPVVIPLQTGDEKTFTAVLDVCGAKDVEPVSEIKIKKSSLPTETRAVYVLSS